MSAYYSVKGVINSEEVKAADMIEDLCHKIKVPVPKEVERIVENNTRNIDNAVSIIDEDGYCDYFIDVNRLPKNVEKIRFRITN